jgi:hypothetical protein
MIEIWIEKKVFNRLPDNVDLHLLNLNTGTK